jgi:hypothetical protein
MRRAISGLSLIREGRTRKATGHFAETPRGGPLRSWNATLGTATHWRSSKPAGPSFRKFQHIAATSARSNPTKKRNLTTSAF